MFQNKSLDYPTNHQQFVGIVGSQNVDLRAGNFIDVRAGAGDVDLNIGGNKPQQFLIIRFGQDGVGGRTLTLGGDLTFFAPTATTLVPTAAAGAFTHYLFFCNEGDAFLLSKE